MRKLVLLLLLAINVMAVRPFFDSVHCYRPVTFDSTVYLRHTAIAASPDSLIVKMTGDDSLMVYPYDSLAFGLSLHGVGIDTIPVGSTATTFGNAPISRSGSSNLWLWADTTSIIGMFDVIYNNVFMGSSSGTTRENNVIKSARIGFIQYDNSEEGTCGLYSYDKSTENKLFIGGGTSAYNAKTSIELCGAANTTTLTGTSHFKLNGLDSTMVLGKIYNSAYQDSINNNPIFPSYSFHRSISYDNVFSILAANEASLGSGLYLGLIDTMSGMSAKGWLLHCSGKSRNNALEIRYGENTSNGFAAFDNDLKVKIDTVGTFITYYGRIKQTTRITNAASPYTVLVTDEIILADTDVDVITVNLPAGVEGTHYRITNVGTHTNNVTVDGNGAETVRGGATLAITDGNNADLYYNATEGWW